MGKNNSLITTVGSYIRGSLHLNRANLKKLKFFLCSVFGLHYLCHENNT